MKIDEIKSIKITLENEEKEKLNEAIKIVTKLSNTMDDYGCRYFQYMDCGEIDSTYISDIEEALHTLQSICGIDEIY